MFVSSHLQIRFFLLRTFGGDSPRPIILSIITIHFISKKNVLKQKRKGCKLQPFYTRSIQEITKIQSTPRKTRMRTPITPFNQKVISAIVISIQSLEFRSIEIQRIPLPPNIGHNGLALHLILLRCLLKWPFQPTNKSTVDFGTTHELPHSKNINNITV